MGGNNILSGGNRDFRTFIDHADLYDLGFMGSPYTWSNNRWGKARILERLDRAPGNGQWCARFRNLAIKHLPRIGSDHVPFPHLV